MLNIILLTGGVHDPVKMLCGGVQQRNIILDILEKRRVADVTVNFSLHK